MNKPVFSNIDSYGLTKRELFAAMAMQALISNPPAPECTSPEIVVDSVWFADMLIAELEKGK